MQGSKSELFFEVTNLQNLIKNYLKIEVDGIDTLPALKKVVIDWVNKSDDILQSVMMRAIKKGSICMVLTLLSAGVNPDIKDDYGHSLLFYTCLYRQPKIAKLLIDNGCNVNTNDEKQNTPLHIACKHSPKIAQLIIDKVSDINFKNKKHQTPLHIACRYSKAKLVKQLLIKGANINALNTYNNKPINVACIYNKVSNVKLLLDSGAKITDLSTSTTIILKRGHIKEYFKLVEMLLNYGADACTLNKECSYTYYNYSLLNEVKKFYNNINQLNIMLRQAINHNNLSEAKAALTKGAQPIILIDILKSYINNFEEFNCLLKFCTNENYRLYDHIPHTVILYNSQLFENCTNVNFNKFLISRCYKYFDEFKAQCETLLMLENRSKIKLGKFVNFLILTDVWHSFAENYVNKK